jgi:hypothetical protein
MRHSHELLRFLARQTDSQDTPTDQETYLRVLCHAEGETVSDPCAVPAAKTAIKLAKDHRRHRRGRLKGTIAKQQLR